METVLPHHKSIFHNPVFSNAHVTRYRLDRTSFSHVQTLTKYTARKNKRTQLTITSFFTCSVLLCLFCHLWRLFAFELPGSFFVSRLQHRNSWWSFQDLLLLLGGFRCKNKLTESPLCFLLVYLDSLDSLAFVLGNIKLCFLQGSTPLFSLVIFFLPKANGRHQCCFPTL